ncbi:MAG: DUF4865 family protein [Geodermatophilaceae bacterium]
MQAMQYEITLPADYDMDIIRRRVATRAHATDAFGGLGLKAYGIRERGVNGSPVNQYAPFYLWATTAGMTGFLLGAGFAGLSNDFGRPPVQHWTGLVFEPGPAIDAVPRAASRSTSRVPPDCSLDAAVGEAFAGVQAYRETAGVHSTALAVDPLSWELVHFTLWAEVAPDTSGVRYEVLHLSRPHLQDLPRA